MAWRLRQLPHTRKISLGSLGCLFVGLITGTAILQAEVTEPRKALELKGEFQRVHDPSIAKSDGGYYVFSTGRGIVLHTSPDLINWSKRTPVFATQPAWIEALIPDVKNYLWAPDISFFNGQWHLYYAASKFGTNRSVIGHATNATLNPDSPAFGWHDAGAVIESHRGDDWNAIDPNVCFDRAGQPWLSFGSFWSGIKLRKLDATGQLSKEDSTLYALASRPKEGKNGTAIEAPFIFQHGDYFYLFVSYDLCCKGADSTYNIRVGRSKEITGPYLDREGKPMPEGGATPVLSSSKRWRGPGHNAVLHDQKTDWLVYHSYDAEDSGISKLRIEALVWDEKGWPMAPSAALTN